MGLAFCEGLVPTGMAREGIALSRTLVRQFAATVALSALTHSVLALSPAEVVIVCNDVSTESVRTAHYYAEQRRIPDANICPITCRDVEAVSREDYDAKIRAPIERFLTDRGLKDKALCLVTVYGVPLRIGDSKLADIEGKIRQTQAQLSRLQKYRNKDDEVAQAKQELERLEKQRAEQQQRGEEAAVDSELTLLFQQYDLASVAQNPFYIAYNRKAERFSRRFNMYMVSRLDAPRPEMARGLVDRAIAAERQGLKGKAYLDARGFTGTGEYALADEAIRRAQADLEQAGFPVVLENTEKLFAPGECPDAALYWGWYSLGKYVPAFRFNVGAVAVHVASSECESLRVGTGWCKRLIEEGVTATIGPTSEPYVTAFPKADLFFKLFLRGAPLAEAYFLSQPYLSWRMVLLGDPLYCPFGTGGK